MEFVVKCKFSEMVYIFCLLRFLQRRAHRSESSAKVKVAKWRVSEGRWAKVQEANVASLQHGEAAKHTLHEEIQWYSMAESDEERNSDATAIGKTRRSKRL